MDSIYQLLISLAYIIPFFLLYSIGIILALTNQNIPAKNARFAIAGFGLLLIDILINTARMIWFVFFASSIPITSISTITAIFSAISVIFSLAGMILLIAAIFVKKDLQN